MAANLLALIRTKYNTLSASQKKVADYVLNFSDKVMISSIADFAEACDVSEPTVFRFLRKIGYDSYQIFRVNIAQELASGKSDNFYSEIAKDDDARNIRDKVLALTSKSLQDSATVIDPEQIEKLVQHILKANRIFIIGMGASAALAYDLHHKLLRLGLDVSYSHDPHMINIICTGLNSQSLLIAFSHSGESREILDGIHFAHEKGAFVASVCSYQHSSVVSKSDCVILSSSYETRFRSDSLTSRIIQFAIIDMIYAAIAVRSAPSMIENINRTRIAVAKNKT